jgi:hypothetical protein
LESVNICSVLIAPRDFILADERSPCLNAGSRKSYHLPIASPSKKAGLETEVINNSPASWDEV